MVPNIAIIITLLSRFLSSPFDYNSISIAHTQPVMFLYTNQLHNDLDITPLWIKCVQCLHRLLVPVLSLAGYAIGSYHARIDKSTYMVNTMPPLMMSLARRGTAPDQKVRMPSSLKMRAAQTKLFL